MAFDASRPAGPATRAIHHGYDPAKNDYALTPPLHLTSTFAFPDAETGGALFAGEAEGHIYSRISNPTVALLEERIASLEGAEAGLATASGMGAISSLMWTLLKPGDEIITDKTLYGCTFAFMRHGLARFGITITHVDLRDPANLAAARRYMGVYLQGARDATIKFANLYERNRDAQARTDYIDLLDDLEENFMLRTETLRDSDRQELDIEIDVLRERLEREGLKPADPAPN